MAARQRYIAIDPRGAKSSREVAANVDIPNYRLTLVPDTNAVFTTKPTARILANGFSTQIEAIRKLCDAEVLVPLAVEEELLYRKRQQLENALIGSRNMQAILAPLPQALSYDFRALDVVQVCAELSRTDQRGTGWSVYTPALRNAPWEEITRRAARRQAPFTPSKDLDVEKGFRDCLVAESFIEIAARVAPQRCVLLTADALLKHYVLERLPNAEVISDLRILEGELNLLKKEHTERRSRELQATATKYFGESRTRLGLFFSENLKTRIEEEFASQFAEQTVPGSDVAAVSSFDFSAFLETSPQRQLWPRAVGVVSHYEPTGLTKFRIGPTAFLKKEGDVYVWRTVVEFITLFRKQGSVSIAAAYSADPPFYVRRLEFAVEWSCRFNGDTVSESEVLSRNYKRTDWQPTQPFDLPHYGWTCHDPFVAVYGLANVSDASDTFGLISDYIA